MTNMQTYYGTKRLMAKPMSSGEYHDYCSFDQKYAEGKNDPGYLVEYCDGEQINDERHDGYISWSPKDVFEKAYQPTDRMNFGHALAALKEGYKVTRRGWSGSMMWLVLVSRTDDVTLREGSEYYNAGLRNVSIKAHIDMMTADGEMQPGWLASQSDMLADDWMIIP